MKRVLDVVIATLALVMFLPLLVVIAVLVFAKMGSPVLFIQDRPGLKGKPFRIYKFCTMKDLRGEEGEPLPDEDRLTVLGKWMRKWSLDELPALFNVLKGEMSIVGPRPLLPQYLDRYTPEQARRHEVKPGVTGWAQVNGRNDISWEEKFELDVWYVDNRSLWLDLKILFLTLIKVINREGISQQGRATVDYFTGSPDSAAKSGSPEKK